MRTFFVWIGRAFSFSTSSSSLTWLTAATNIRNGLKSSASWSAYRRCCGYRATSSTTSPPTGISVSDTWVRKTQKHQEDSVERPHQTADFHFCLFVFLLWKSLQMLAKGTTPTMKPRTGAPPVPTYEPLTFSKDGLLKLLLLRPRRS